MLTRPWRFAWLLLAAVFGFVAGCVLAAFTPQPPLLPRTESVPLPHHVPRFAGGASFRYAMAHDVLHERYPRHGADHYRERNRITREKLARLASDDPARFPLIDDLAAGVTRLGQLDEAIELLRAKLVQQQSRGMAGRDLYTTYANLGAILYHRHLADAMAGDESALDHAREGRDFVRKSVAVNPESHFGREQWQVAYGEFLLDAIDDPDLLTRFDFIGNRLDYTSDKPRDTGNPDLEYGHAVGRDYYRSDTMSRSRPLAENPSLVNDPAGWESIRQVRDYITKVGGEAGFPRPDLRAPFDEPLLGIIGMWRQGIGADPHFALCIGEIMLRIGQRHIAWAAFERASRLSEKFWPDPLMQQFLRDHCRKRQAEIQKSLEWDQNRITELNVPLSAEQIAKLREEFEKELAHGECFQKAYQAHETRKIASGTPLGDEHFYDEFFQGREPIATTPGGEEWFTWDPWHNPFRDRMLRVRDSGIFGAGLSALVMALFLRSRSARDLAAP